MKQIVLASASPRRKALLRDHFHLTIQAADCNERRKSNESPRTYVRRIARAKWIRISQKQKRDLSVLSADTAVVLKKEIFGKAASARAAEIILKKLSGQTHRVITAVCVGRSLRKIPEKVWITETKVRFRKLTQSELKTYIASKEWKDKAGAYAIQGRAMHFVASIEGSLTNVVGLPLEEALDALQS